VANLDFCVTIADPNGDDTCLIAVSEGFERMTGYSSEEIVGRNCRFLNEGCDLSPWQRMGLRVASQTGALFSAVITNRKKSGELFKNLLNMRGLVIAQNAVTGEDIWLLVGIQADVSDFDEIPEDQLAAVARRIRRKLVKHFAILGFSAVLRSGGDAKIVGIPESRTHSGGPDALSEWRVFADAVWKEGSVSAEERTQGPQWAVVPDTSPASPDAAAVAGTVAVTTRTSEAQLLIPQVRILAYAVAAGIFVVVMHALRGLRKAR
jgi:hypothetical protein